MNSLMEKCCDAASYSRLSQDDGDKAVSDSIRNQQELIRNYQKSHPEIHIVEEYSDDGYSGVSFERPGFQKMLEDIKNQKINCIIVKDLSRFGRNYIETGKYLEQIFPALGVRFIAINDNYDSAGDRQQSDQIIIPFKNLMNDSYCRDISIKIRTNLKAKRKKGDFVGAFAPYGYKKDDNDRNQLVVDWSAAKVVQRIFKLKIEGMSNNRIAELLNSEGIYSPYEYKKHSEQGKNFANSYYVSNSAQWTPSAVIRILGNEVYLGHMVQGKTLRPNYKVKAQLPVDQSEWIRVENTHEAIISQNDFAIVQKLFLMDARTPCGEEQVHLFSGLVYCGKCKNVLRRKAVTVKGEKYVYYGCYDEGRTLRCKGISISEEILEKTVLETIKKHIEVILEMDELVRYVDELPLRQKEIQNLNEQMKNIDDDIHRYSRLKNSLHGDYKEGMIDQEEYLELKKIYTDHLNKFKDCMLELENKRQELINGKSRKEECVELFRVYRNINKLDRRMLLTLVDKIEVHSHKRITIRFSYQNEFERMEQLKEMAREEG